MARLGGVEARETPDEEGVEGARHQSSRLGTPDPVRKHLQHPRQLRRRVVGRQAETRPTRDLRGVGGERHDTFRLASVLPGECGGQGVTVLTVPDQARGALARQGERIDRSGGERPPEQALDARYTLQSVDGQREVRALDYYEGAYFTARADNEILTAIAFDAPAPGHGHAYEKQKRKVGDYATAAAAVIIRAIGVFGLITTLPMSSGVARASRRLGRRAIGGPFLQTGRKSLISNQMAHQESAVCPHLRVGGTLPRVGGPGPWRESLQAIP